MKRRFEILWPSENGGTNSDEADLDEEQSRLLLTVFDNMARNNADRE